MEHSFGFIRSISDFQDRVPIITYEDVEKYIERISKGENAVLTQNPVMRFGVTSGSTAAYKLIPYTQKLIDGFQKGIDPWIFNLFKEHPSLLTGKAYWSVTPVGDRVKYTQSGIPIGFEDERSYFSPVTRWVLDSIMVAPSCLAEIEDMDTFFYVTLRVLLQEKDLAWISIWNPSFLSLLLDRLDENFESLVSDLEQGRLTKIDGLSNGLLERILQNLKSDKKRAMALRTLRKTWKGDSFLDTDIGGETFYEKVWPRVQLISCWAHANASIALPEMRKYFPHAKLQPKGLLATEAFVSFPIEEDLSALSYGSHFFEFETENGSKILLANQLKKGGRYSVIVTTSGGLYRYRLNDIIEVDGFLNGCPLIRFVERQHKVVDIVGEKLNEEFVRQCVMDALEASSIQTDFWMVAPITGSERPSYVCFIQPSEDGIPNERFNGFSNLFESYLSQAYHYAYARKLGQLDPCRVFLIGRDVPAQTVYLQACAEMGQRLGDIKPAALHPYQKWAEIFEGKIM